MSSITFSSLAIYIAIGLVIALIAPIIYGFLFGITKAIRDFFK